MAHLDSTGAGTITVRVNNAAMEWDIYQISIATETFEATCNVEILYNGFFMCASPVGSRDTATGPPDVVIRPGDELTVNFVGGPPLQTATVGIWYNENVQGTTTSTAH